MNRRLSPHALALGGLLCLGLLLGACGPRSTTMARGGSATGATVTTHAESTSPTVVAGDDHGEEDNGTLTPARRAELGLTGMGAVQAPTPQQWADPQAVAARFVLADTTYSAAESPAAVSARRAAYTTPRLAADPAGHGYASRTGRRS